MTSVTVWVGSAGRITFTRTVDVISWEVYLQEDVCSGFDGCTRTIEDVVRLSAGVCGMLGLAVSNEKMWGTAVMMLDKGHGVRRATKWENTAEMEMAWATVKRLEHVVATG